MPGNLILPCFRCKKAGMAEAIGSILKREREARRLTIEEVAHELRMKSSRVVDLENDRYTDFPNPIYARLFFTRYCRFLDIQVTRDIEQLFPDDLAGMDDYDYIRKKPHRVKRPARLKRSRSLAVAAFVGTLLLLVTALAGIAVFWTVEQLGDIRTRIEQRAEKKRAELDAKDASMLQAPELDPEAPPAPETASKPAEANDEREVVQDVVAEIAAGETEAAPAELTTEQLADLRQQIEGPSEVVDEGVGARERLPDETGQEEEAGLAEEGAGDGRSTDGTVEPEIPELVFPELESQGTESE